MYSETCLNRNALKRRPYWEGQTRFIQSVFYMISFHAFLKQKTVKRTLLPTDNVFSPQIKKDPALHGHKTFRNSWETENCIGHFCHFSQKETFFYTSKQHFFFWFQFAVLKACNTFDSNSLSFIISCSLQPTNNC